MTGWREGISQGLIGALINLIISLAFVLLFAGIMSDPIGLWFGNFLPMPFVYVGGRTKWWSSLVEGLLSTGLPRLVFKALSAQSDAAQFLVGSRLRPSHPQ